jgi:hypothetical protein
VARDIIKDYRRLCTTGLPELVSDVSSKTVHMVKFSRGLFGKKKAQSALVEQLLANLSPVDKRDAKILNRPAA